MDPIDGALVEPKKASVAAHFRRVSEGERHRIKDVVDEILAAHPDR
jgi:trehalose-6-phosphatase